MTSWIPMNAVAVDQAITAAEHNNIISNMGFLADGNANIQTILSGSGTGTIPAGVTKVYPLAKGGCGGGGGLNGATRGGGGGGGGGIADNFGITVAAGDTIAYSIGVGGIGGAVGAPGTAGTATTFTIRGKTYTAPGGGAGLSTVGGSAGGGAGNNFASNGTAGVVGSGGIGGGSLGGDNTGGDGGTVGAGENGQNGFLILRYSPVSQGIGAASQSLDITSADQLAEITSEEIVITGTSAVARTVTFPAGIKSQKGHVIKNNTTGSSTVVNVIVSGGTGITLDVASQGGKTVHVYSDGTNLYYTDSHNKYPTVLSNVALSANAGTVNIYGGRSNIIEVTGTLTANGNITSTIIDSLSPGILIVDNLTTLGAYTLYLDSTYVIPPQHSIWYYNGSTFEMIFSDTLISTSATADMFLNNTDIIAAGAGPQTLPVKTLDRSATQTSEVILSQTVNTGVAAIAQLGVFMDGTFGMTTIPAGQWDFHLFRACNSTNGANEIISTVWRNIVSTGTIAITGAGTSRTATVIGGTPFVAGDVGADMTLSGYIQTPNARLRITGYTANNIVTVECLAGYTNETGVAYTVDRYMFSTTTGDIQESTVTEQVPWPCFQPAFTVNSTDRMVLGFFAKTSAAADRTITLYFGSANQHYSHLHPPIAIKHNDLAGINEGTIQHHTLTEMSNHPYKNTANTWAELNTFNQYIWFPSAGLVWMRGDPATEAAERKYFDTYANMLNPKAVTATYAAGVMTYTVAAGHGLSSGTTTDRVTVRGFDQADYNVTKSTYTYISATQFSVTTAGAPASPGTGATPLSYTLNLFENFYAFNVGVDTATGIFAGRDITNIVSFYGRAESGTEYEYYHASAAAGTVPTWVNNFAKNINGAFAFGGRGLFSTGTVYPVIADTYNLGTSTVPYLGLYQSYTNTATVGNVTINKPCGRVNIGAGGTTMTLTNNTFTAATQGSAHLTAADATAKIVYMTFAAGSATITLDAACTAQVAIDFITNRT